MFLRATKRRKDGLWDMLELDGFWSKRLVQSRKGTDWLALLKAIVIYRLTAPGSELQMHERWLKDSAAEELFGSGVLTGKSTLYNCLDKALYPLEEWKKERNKRTVTSRMICSIIFGIVGRGFYVRCRSF